SGPYFRCIEFSHGNERRHGTHHDAQKSTQMTRPSTGSSAAGGAARVTAATQRKATAIDHVTFKRMTPPCPIERRRSYDGRQARIRSRRGQRAPIAAVALAMTA